MDGNGGGWSSLDSRSSAGAGPEGVAQNGPALKASAQGGSGSRVRTLLSGVVLIVAGALLGLFVVTSGHGEDQERASSSPPETVPSGFPRDAVTEVPSSVPTTVVPLPSVVSAVPQVAPPQPGEEAVDRWIAQLASVPIDQGQDRLNVVLSSVRSQIGEAAVLRSDAFAALRPGYWVIYVAGPFRNGVEVLDFCSTRGRPSKSVCIGRFLSHNPADSERMCFRSEAGTLTAACAG